MDNANSDEAPESKRRLAPIPEEWQTKIHPDLLRQAVDHFESCINGAFGEESSIKRAVAFLMREAKASKADAERTLRAQIEQRKARRARK